MNDFLEMSRTIRYNAYGSSAGLYGAQKTLRDHFEVNKIDLNRDFVENEKIYFRDLGSEIVYCRRLLLEFTLRGAKIFIENIDQV